MTAPSPVWWALSHERDIPADRPVGVTIGDVPLVLFRDGAGHPRALLDRCAHRRAPLSLGQRTDDGLVQCPYHGWRYDGSTGQCRAIPNFSTGERVPGNFAVPSFPVENRDGILFTRIGPAMPHGMPPEPAPENGTDLSLHRVTRFLPCPHEMAVRLLLDRPGAILALRGAVTLDDFRWGDPREEGGWVLGEFGAVPGRKAPARLPTDPPLILSVAVAAHSGAARIALRDGNGALRAAAFVAPVPDGDMVTRFVIVCQSSPHHGIDLRPALDVAEVTKTRLAAFPVWQALGRERADT